MPRPRTQHRNNVPILRGGKHDISLKILHQAEFEHARQAVTLAKLRALTIAPRPLLTMLVHVVQEMASVLSLRSTTDEKKLLLTADSSTNMSSIFIYTKQFIFTTPCTMVK